jgi:circadian clock protein KaiC
MDRTSPVRYSAVTERATTGIPGLDNVLQGGLLPNQVYLIEGDPGTGKTTLALQFLLAGEERSEKGLYITLSESRAELKAMATSHGWSLDRIEICELIPTEAQLSPDAQYTFFHSEEVELHETVQALIREVETARPARLVIDSLSELRLLSEEPQRYRRQALALKRYFESSTCTVLLLDDRTSQSVERQLHGIVHGVITLERLPRTYGKNRRRLEVAKLRGQTFVEGYHDYTIQTGGLQVFPRLIAAAHAGSFQRDALSSMIPELDDLLGGGLDRGSSTLVLGPAGAGKTTLATRYATAAISRGEKVALYTFDEGLGSLLVRSAGLGMTLESHLEAGRIIAEHVDPAELSPGEFAARVREHVEREGVRLIIIDSLNGYLSAMPEEQFLTLQMHELLSYLNQQGVVTILVLAQQGLVGSMQNPIDVSYLADTIILLRFFEAHGEVRRALSVLKRRSSHHECAIRELQIGGTEGIRVGSLLYEFRGVLTGVPEYTGQAQPPAMGKSDDRGR